MNDTQQKHFRTDKVLYLPPPCELCERDEGIAGGARLYSLEIVRGGPLLLLFGLLADDLRDLTFKRHQIEKLVNREQSCFVQGMKTHLFMGSGGYVFSVRFGEDGLFHFETHNLLCINEMWPGDGGHRIYVPDYLIR